MNIAWNAYCAGKASCEFNPSNYLTNDAFEWREEALVNPANDWGEYYYYEFETVYWEVEFYYWDEDENARRNLEGHRNH